ncbi:MAG: Mitofusin-2 [Paramarteilia canceri]
MSIDYSPEIDNLIAKFCIDADLFIFVNNGESSLMQVEKEFFKLVIDRVANPEIIFVVNQWDKCIISKDTDINCLSYQHLERIKDFLSNTLNLSTENFSVNKDIFFISASLALQERLHRRETLPKNFKKAPDQQLLPVCNALNESFDNFLNELDSRLTDRGVCEKLKRLKLALENVVEDFEGLKAEKIQSIAVKQ